MREIGHLKLAGVDLTYVETILGDKADLLIELLDDLCCEGKQLAALLPRDAPPADRISAAAAVHRLKGATGNLGVRTLYLTLQQLEAALKCPEYAADKSDDHSAWQALRERFDAGFRALEEALETTAQTRR